MQLNITPTQFSTLQEKLSADHDVTISETTDVTGTLTTHDVTLSYSYDGTSVLDIEVTAKHSFEAKVAPESVIDGKITDLFQQYIA